MRPAGLALVFLIAAIAAEDATAACSCDWLCVTGSETDGRLRLLAENRSAVPLTFTLRLDTRQLQVEGPAEHTETLAPGQSTRLSALERRDVPVRIDHPYRCQWTIGDEDAIHDDSQVYLLPYARGTSYRVLQGFGSRFSHTGLEEYAVDFKMDEGTPVYAARGGVVARIEESHERGCWSEECASDANYIVILHDDGTTGEYYHLQQNGALVGVGEQIEAGQKIGLSGNTGHSTLPHLHFGVYRAIGYGKEQSVPFRFLSADGIIDRPRRGGLYLATGPRHDVQRVGAEGRQAHGY